MARKGPIRDPCASGINMHQHQYPGCDAVLQFCNMLLGEIG